MSIFDQKSLFSSSSVIRWLNESVSWSFIMGRLSLRTISVVTLFGNTIGRFQWVSKKPNSFLVIFLSGKPVSTCIIKRY